MKFYVFNNGKVADDFELSAAYMFGSDAIPLAATEKIRCKNGIIECRLKGVESAGLALLWTVDEFGKILLPTTRLPERKEPYNLNVELARAKLMQITLKQEDWSLFEETNSLAEHAHRARSLFIEALQAIADPAKASVLADESLKKSLVFSEKLTAKHADMLFDARCGRKGLGRHSLGCRVDHKLLDNDKYRKWLFDMFGFVTIPVNWAKIEPDRGRYDFSSIDHCIEKVAGRRFAVCAGPLLCFAEDSLPRWLPHGKWEFERIRDYAYDFVSTIVTRYTGYIHAWRVISGMNALNKFSFNFEQIIEMTRTACLAAKSADGKSRKMVEILYPWGEYYAHDRDTIPPLVYTDMVIQSGISFDAFALLIHLGKDRPGLHIRDMMQISSMLDCFAPVAKPVHITGVAVPSHSGQGPDDCENTGYWHKKWTPLLQSQWVEKFYKMALSKPFINSITYSNLADTEDLDIYESGLLTSDMAPKESFLALAKLQKLILNR